MVIEINKENQLNLDKSRWKKTKLSEVSTSKSVRENNPSESEYERFIGSSSISEFDLEVVNWDDTSSVTSAMKVFRSGEYLLVRRSVAGNQFKRRAARANFSGICSGDIINIKENELYLADGFLSYILYSDNFWQHAIRNASGSITSRVKWKNLEEFEFLLPPIEEQKKLSELLWSLESSLASLKKLENKLKVYLESSRSTFIGSVKKSQHQIVQIKDIGSQKKQSVQVGPFGGTVNSRHFVKSGVPVIKINNLDGNGELDLSKLVYISKEHAATLKRYNIESGDILTAAQATTGRTVIADESIEGAIISQHLIRVAVDNTLCYPEYLYEVFLSNVIISQINLVKAKTTRDGLNTEDVSTFKIPLPKLSEQKEFIQQVALIRDAHDKCRRQLMETQEFIKSLINSVQ